MRENKGKLIVVWVPGNHGAGGSTIANAAGIALQHVTGNKTLIVNWGSSRNYMEQYMKNDVDIRFSLDYLKSFDLGLRSEHIETYSTPVNEGLYLLPNCKISGDITRVGEGFDQRFIDNALEAYELVIVDLETGLNDRNCKFLDRADIILAVMDANNIMLEELYNSQSMVSDYLKNEKTIAIFNAIHTGENEKKLLGKFNKKLDLQSSYGIPYDIKSNKAACHEGKFYSYMKQELNKNKNDSSFPGQMRELSGLIAEKLFIATESYESSAGLIKLLFARARHWGELDA